MTNLPSDYGSDIRVIAQLRERNAELIAALRITRANNEALKDRDAKLVADLAQCANANAGFQELNAKLVTALERIIEQAVCGPLAGENELAMMLDNCVEIAEEALQQSTEKP